jgi:hypothetical protein
MTLSTPDADFLDIDQIQQGHDRALILVHGLEGNSSSSYIRGMAAAGLKAGFELYALNQRGCSGRMNATAKSYHSGKSEDLDVLLTQLTHYRSIALVGFSLGGNVVLKRMGEGSLADNVSCAVGISVPVDLADSARTLSNMENTIYRQRFLRQLRRKAREKALAFPDVPVAIGRVLKARSFMAFDDAYTAPINGFESADDYYRTCSARRFLSDVDRPTLLINAQNDSFLGRKCYPTSSDIHNERFHALYPRYGGHVGFSLDTWMKGIFWHERVVIEFIQTFAA